MPMMDKTELVDRMNALQLSITDVALVAGTTRRAVEKWRSGQHPVPRTVCLVLDAMRDDKIDGDWLMDWLIDRVGPTP